MARKRQIAPEFFSDETISRLSLEAAFLYIGLWCFADDAGNIEGSPAQWRLWVFPGRAVTVEQVRGWRRELETTGRIVAYTVAGVEYYNIPSLLRHQTINHPSKPRCPDCPVPKESHPTTGVVRENSGRTTLGLPKSRVEGVSRVEPPPPGTPPLPPAALHNVTGNDGAAGDADSPTPSKIADPPGVLPRKDKPAPAAAPPDADSGALDSDPALGTVVRAYEELTSRPISPAAAARLGELCDEHTPANVARAIERVAQRGVRPRNPSYLLPVLREMAQAGDEGGYAPHGRITDGSYAPRGRHVDAPYSIR